MTSLHDFTLKDIDGNERSLGEFRGKACLVVNVASKCGLTPQYTELQKLYEDRQGAGVEVLGFPCNQFLGQEPGSESEIKAFCSTSYGVSFPLFAKIEVNGDGRHPLYAWLTAQDTQPEGPGDIQWNFGKFVVDKQGQVVARFEPATKPDDPALLEALDRALA